MDNAPQPQITPFMPLPPRKFVRREKLDANIADFISGCELLSSGRGALLRALDIVKFGGVLHVPEFFCPALKKILSAKFRVKTFLDIPSEPRARFDTIEARDGDAVLAVNFFGLRNSADWYSWAGSRPKIILIEDHSHAPFSDWAMNTRADFSFASLRKCFPLPDGAYLRSKNFSPSKIYSGGGEQPDFSRDALAAALEQADVVGTLQLADVFADGGLADVQLLRGPGKTQVAGHAGKYFQTEIKHSLSLKKHTEYTD